MVYIVGAGPGAEDLITVRGARLLKEADVVIYAGSLVNPGLLKETKSGCRIYNSAVMTLEEVVETVKNAEKNGLMTVRLHTGDPCLYGAVREQMDAFESLGIPYEVCPGGILILRSSGSSENGIHPSWDHTEYSDHQDGWKDAGSGEREYTGLGGSQIYYGNLSECRSWEN